MTYVKKAKPVVDAEKKIGGEAEQENENTQKEKPIAESFNPSDTYKHGQQIKVKVVKVFFDREEGEEYVEHFDDRIAKLLVEGFLKIA